MQILSHRGVTDAAIENTFEAFEAAVALGVDGIETDVHRTRDGALVVHHDFHVRGTRIAGVSHAELESLVGHTVPTVDGCLERWPTLLWNFELKARDAGEPLRALLRAREAADVVVSSFLHPTAARFCGVAGCRAGVLITHEPLAGGLPLEVWKGAGVDVVVVYFGVLTEEVRGEVGEAGMACWTYGPQSPEDHARCWAWGLEAVITDFVGRARR